MWPRALSGVVPTFPAFDLKDRNFMFGHQRADLLDRSSLLHCLLGFDSFRQLRVLSQQIGQFLVSVRRHVFSFR
ncbi:hypothetical protein WK55_09760 [Burkholderia ubonensis]|nr:hypothetical protein WK55_09760 [Burkholderia ubonensis]